MSTNRKYSTAGLFEENLFAKADDREENEIGNSGSMSAIQPANTAQQAEKEKKKNVPASAEPAMPAPLSLGKVAGSRIPGSSSSTRFIDSFKEYMVPKDTPERRRRVYSLSQEALDDVVNEYYNKELKTTFDSRRKDAAAKARNVLEKEAAVLRDNPMQAYARAAEVEDLSGVMDETMKGIDDSKLRELLSPLASQGGFDKDDYIEKFVKPSLREKMVGEYVKESKPKSSGEYIIRSAIDNSLMGKIVSLPVAKEKGVADRMAVDKEALAGYKAGRLEDFAAGLGSLVVDLPLFSKLGKVSSLAVSAVGRRATPVVAKRIAGKVMSGSLNPRMNPEFATRVAERAIKQNLKYRLTGGVLSQGLTLGNYDASNSVVGDLLSGEGVDWSAGAASFGKGFLLGGGSAAAAAPLRVMSKGAKGAKRLFYSAGVLSSESAVFTAGSEIGKIAQGIEVEPVDLFYDFTGSAATILAMRLAHWRPKGGEYKLDYNGRLKKHFKLSPSEMKEVENAGFNPNEFVAAIERELKIPSYGGSENADMVKEVYSRLMTDKNLSASAKSKLMLLVENKVTSTPPVPFDYAVDRVEDGNYEVKLFDFEGNLIEKNLFDSMDGIRSYMFVQQGKLRKNRIELFDRELTAGLQSQNFYRHASEYLRESGTDVNEFVDAVYDRSQGKELAPRQQRMVDEVLARSSFDNEGMVKYLYDARRGIEQKHGLEENSLVYKAAEPYYMLRENEIAAIREYEELLYSEVEQLKKGADAGRVAEMSALANGNGSVKSAKTEFRERDEKVTRENILGTMDADLMSEKPLDVFKAPARGVVWNVYGNDFTKEQFDSHKRLVRKMSRKLGVEINIIADERELERPDPANREEVREYNNQVRSYGWIQNGKVYINLPNCPTPEAIESTIVHEVVGHYGLEKVFGYHLYDFLEDVYKGADDKLRAEMEQMGKGQYRGANHFLVVEEYLAHLAEKAWLNEKERTVMQRFKDFIKDMFRRMGIYTGSAGEISIGEIEQIMALHCRYVRRKVAPERHRKEVFGRFGSSHKPKEGYYNHDAYLDDVKSRIADGIFFRSTPDYLRGFKAMMNYDRLPAEYKEKFLKDNSHLSEEQVYEVLKDRKYRSSGNGDKKTSLGERGGVIPGNPSSKGLLYGSSGHLSRYSLATHEDVTKLMKNNLITKSSAVKIINEGGFSGLQSTEDAVRKIGESLKLIKSRSSQSYYGNFYEGDIVVDGKSVHLRISTHPATGERMGNHPADDRISVVIYKNGEHVSHKEHGGYTEYVYYPSEVSLENAANSILKGVVNLIDNGKFIDETGKARKMEYPYWDNGILRYRLPSENEMYRTRDKKTSLGERGGADSDNPSSKGLQKKGSEHLSRNPLAHSNDDANIVPKELERKYSFLNNMKNGEFGSSNDEPVSVGVSDVSDYGNHENDTSSGYATLMERIRDEYKAVKHDADFVEAVRKGTRMLGSDSVAGKAFLNKYGIQVDDFKNKFPTEDEYIYYRLVENGAPFHNAAEAQGTGNGIAGISDGDDRVREMSLSDIKRRLYGPLDILSRSSAAGNTMLGRVGRQLMDAGLSIAERADIEDELEAYTAHLLKKRKAGNVSPSPTASVSGHVNGTYV